MAKKTPAPMTLGADFTAKFGQYVSEQTAFQKAFMGVMNELPATANVDQMFDALKAAVLTGRLK